jgi:nitronate monooxygenase
MPTFPKADLARLKSRLRLPVIGAPLYIVSYPDLVIAQCKAGIIGSFPALNARPKELLDEWLHRIREELAAHDRAHPERPSAPFAVNQIVHRSNDRLEHDVGICVKHKVPISITSLGARPEVFQAFQSYGALCLHDIIDNTFARKAIDKGAHGLIAVAAGAGGHAGRQSPMALIREIREWFDGPLALSGAIAHGRSILAAEAMGADFAYIGSMFIASQEANSYPAYKQDIVESGAADIVYTDLFTGVHGNYLRNSILRAGLDPDNLPVHQKLETNFGSERQPKPWKDIWGSGQGIGAVKAVEPVAAMVERIEQEYREGKAALCG